MAELTKKIHLKKGTTEQTAKAYSTTAEAGGEYIFCKIDNVNAYIPIGATSDGRATMGRVTKNGTKAILKNGKPPYTETSWTTAGTYTWTCPQGVTRVRVAVCGGGGNGCSSLHVLAPIFKKGNSGSSSSAFEVVATGGIGGGSSEIFPDTGLDTKMIGQAGTPNGYNGTYAQKKYSDRTLGFACSFSKTNGDYGYGAGGFNVFEKKFYAYGGGSGGYNSTYCKVVPLATYTIIVGSGGAAYETSLNSIEAGGDGFVLIAFGGDI